MEYRPDAVYKTPEYVELETAQEVVLLDPEKPQWIATDRRGRDIARLFNGERTMKDIVARYQERYLVDPVKAYVDVNTFLEDALRAGFILRKMSRNGDHLSLLPAPYPGREAYLKNAALKELWLHTNNVCNLTCRHCLVSSSPRGGRGLSFEKLCAVIEEAYSLGVRRFFFTGGEPFARPDIFELIHEVLHRPETELVILTNATLLTKERLEKFKDISRERLHLQVSLDGASEDMNDSVRGKGTHKKILQGVRNLISIGFKPTLTTVITSANAEDIPGMPALVKSLGLSRLHLLWLHKRGRALDFNDLSLSTPELVGVVAKTLKVTHALGVEIDNFGKVLARIQNTPGEKFDLSTAGYESLCVYSDGQVYPSAALANIPELACGSILEDSLESIYKNSLVLKSFREASVLIKDVCQNCHLKFICGGGDIEHSYYYSSDDPKQRTILGEDPYCDIHKFLYMQAFHKVISEGQGTNLRSGFTSPFIIRSMGDALKNNAGKNGNGTSASRPVHLSHSECVLTFRAYEGRKKVQQFYKKAAVTPQAELCCPTKYDPADVGHIPQDVLDRFYGCGSPVALAQLKEGETFLDLGSGAGIDVFTAAKKVGALGRAIGVDMTDEMLAVAAECKNIVAQNLGYDNTAFYKGYLEDLPVSDKSVDCITSNCVINLSVNKGKVFSEMWRALKDNGRIVVSDIVSEKPLSVTIHSNPKLWGECIGGALTENEFIALLKKLGFYGIETLKKTFWKTVEGYNVFSVTVRGYKFEKKAGCTYAGQYAVYQGPFEAVVDEEGHFFPRGQKVEICTDTFEKLSHPPYQFSFVLLDADESVKKNWEKNLKEEKGVGCTPGCC